MPEDRVPLSENKERKRWFRRRSFVIALGVFILVALYFSLPVLMVLFVAQPVRIEGAAMSPTLNSGDRVFISKSVSELNRGDIVVFYYPTDTTKSLIKRIVGLPGERIKIDGPGQVYINGDLLSEPYLADENNRSRRVMPEYSVKADHYYVMGDNRDASNDSRFFGVVAKELIYGKIAWKYWPLGRVE